jgi:hypothetical protein
MREIYEIYKMVQRASIGAIAIAFVIVANLATVPLDTIDFWLRLSIGCFCYALPLLIIGVLVGYVAYFNSAPSQRWRRILFNSALGVCNLGGDGFWVLGVLALLRHFDVQFWVFVPILAAAMICLGIGIWTLYVVVIESYPKPKKFYIDL